MIINFLSHVSLSIIVQITSSVLFGIFKRNSSNTKEIEQTLKTHNLEYLPEAHNYLKYKNEIYDFTKKHSKPSDFVNELLEEIEIKPEQITSFKVDYHKEYLKKWLTENGKIKFTLNEIWKIREKCIENLTENWKTTTANSRFALLREKCKIEVYLSQEVVF